MQEYENIFKYYKNYYLFYVAKHEDSAAFLKEVFLHPKIINQKNSKGESLSHLLCYEGMTEKYFPFLEMGGLNFLTEQKNNVLHYCVSSGADIFLMIDLINKGINPIDRNQFGQTPMHMLNSTQAASYFTNWNFRTFSKMENIKDNEGNTIAHSAAINKNPNVVKFLLNEYPKLKSIKNNLGLTPEQILFLLYNPFFNSYYQTEICFKTFLLGIDELKFNLFLPSIKNFDSNYCEIVIDREKTFFIDNNLFNNGITRDNLTLIEKLKPLSLQMLRYEAKELFKDSFIYQNEITELYRDKILEREYDNTPEHNFNFDISKKFL